MKNLFFALLCLTGFQLSAQTFEFSGKITDSETKQPLEAATVYIEDPADSTVVSYTISEKDGNFLLTGNSSAQKLNLLVSFTGYQVHKQNISLADGLVKTVGTIEMKIADNALDEVQLVGARAPIVIKKDTLEFNASSFATRPDANLEELMKKLPGVEVDSQGNITVNGK
ncbi:carboxypeptidase-like regulatory domain-containing protein [Antarcticibacterium sp. 1MA-6-2]|uniref:carboxypeptidase-like regulatory domain-containing protein n=1 Tax=Antarcticibacterium sp. 1MA-6-2 TaxID=2908210 RepID=UPI001F1ACD35|nr:carboxypeptidase-like regulatory domain-containing protein [Antarcticibacterium sp. 1MA-6-2]UJH92303.1 carboxypeptidase-like regulatory domain-containing protein [Antarcticibacterium sp. 1MA-6-2]